MTLREIRPRQDCLAELEQALGPIEPRSEVFRFRHGEIICQVQTYPDSKTAAARDFSLNARQLWLEQHRKS